MKRKPFFILIPITALFALSAVVMLLWNALLPDLFNLPEVTYWQAFGLFALSRLLFGSFGFGRRHNGPPFGKPHLREKWENMSEEEKQHFRERLAKRCSPRKDDE
jgi:hypothetical protein